MKGLIFGAKSVAIGVCRALKELWPEIRIFGFLVSSLENNPKELEGMPVWELAEASAKLTDEEKRKSVCILPCRRSCKGRLGKVFCATVS